MAASSLLTTFLGQFWLSCQWARGYNTSRAILCSSRTRNEKQSGDEEALAIAKAREVNLGDLDGVVALRRAEKGGAGHLNWHLFDKKLAMRDYIDPCLRRSLFSASSAAERCGVISRSSFCTIAAPNTRKSFASTTNDPGPVIRLFR